MTIKNHTASSGNFQSAAPDPPVSSTSSTTRCNRPDVVPATISRAPKRGIRGVGLGRKNNTLHEIAAAITVCTLPRGSRLMHSQPAAPTRNARRHAPNHPSGLLNLRRDPSSFGQMPKLSRHPGHTNPDQRANPVGQPAPRAREYKPRHGLCLPVEHPQNIRFWVRRKAAHAAFMRLFLCELLLRFLLRGTWGILHLDEPVHLPHLVPD